MEVTRSILVLSGLCALAVSGCMKHEAAAPPAAPQPTTAVTTSEGPGSVAAAVTTTATVESVDQKTRMVTLRNADNELITHDRLMDDIGMNWSSLTHFRLWTIPAATFVQASPGVAWTMLLLVGLPMIALEFLAGSWRALVTFLLCDWLTAPVTVLILWALSNLGDANASRHIAVRKKRMTSRRM